MGGSGGGFFGRSEKPSEIIEKIKRDQHEAQSREFESEVNKIISEILRDANDRDTESVRNHLDTILKTINNEIDGSVQTLFGGSVSKNTYVEGLSDIDVMLVLNNSELANKSPLEVKKYLIKQLRKRLPKTYIKSGKMAITIKFSDGLEIQILPCIKTSTGLKITQANSDKWSNVIKPKKFAEKLVEINKKCHGKAIPVIKLAKSIISEFSKKRQLTGYHIESLAVSIFSNYKGKNNSKAMLKEFFNKAAKMVLSPIKDKTGQTINTDSYLGSKESIERKAASDSLSRIVRRIESAERSQNLDKWKDLLG